MSDYEITWEVYDGYAGGSAPQHLNMDIEDFEGCETVVDVTEVINTSVQDDFDDKVSWHFYNGEPDYEAILIAVKAKEAAEEIDE